MRAGLEIAGWWAVLVLVWLATLNAYSVEELSVAGVLAVPCAIVARTARRAGAGHWTAYDAPDEFNAILGRAIGG